MPNAISWWVSTSSDKYIIQYTHGVAQTGLYAAAYKIPSLMTVFTSVFLSAWQISAVEDFGTEKSIRLYTKVYRYFFACLLTVCAAVVAFAKLATTVLFDEKFHAAWTFVPLLVLAYLFHDLASFIGSVYTASKKTKMLFWSTAAGALVNIGLNILLIPRYGASGAALTTFLSYFLVWAIRFFDTRKILRLPYRYLSEGISLLLVIAETIVITWNFPHAFLCGVVIFAVILILQARTLAQIAADIFHGLKSRHNAKAD